MSSKNLLATELSPYLLQHQNNPVHWQPWNKDAFLRAESEQKPILLSIGYSTCHWCHVMEKDSFEKQDIAEVLNQNFIPIKADREERPDVDSLYMNAVQALSGRGGWPMTVLLNPKGEPFWGGTFVTHDQFLHLLTQVSEIWKNSPEEIHEGAKRLSEFLKNQLELPKIQGRDGDSNSAFEDLKDSSGLRNFKALEVFSERFLNRFDKINGGYSGAPKFPPHLAISTLLRSYHSSHDPEVLKAVAETLDQMRRGGIYDQVGFGFHRYSTDDHWLVPHFEKMLYDNSQLAMNYLEAFQVTKKDEYAKTAREIFEYISRDMTSADGSFFSAEDADSENIEGKFYVWNVAELQEILTASEFDLLKSKYNISLEENFHAHRTGDEVTAKRLGPPAVSGHILFLKNSDLLPGPEMALILEKLLKRRSLRVRPHLDDKILVSWNALMISAFAKGYQVLRDEKYLFAATKALDFLLRDLCENEGHPSQQGQLWRSYRNGVRGQKALSDDYAFLIRACLDVYECDFDSKWFNHALVLQKKFDEKFWDPADYGYFDGDGSDVNLILRSKTFEDGVTPSANSIACFNLLRLSNFCMDLEYKTRALEILNRAKVLIEKYPHAVPALLWSVGWLNEGSSEICLIGDLTSKEISTLLAKLGSDFVPYLTLAANLGDVEKIEDVGAGGIHPPNTRFLSSVPLLKNKKPIGGEPTIYFCQNETCLLPTTDFAEFKVNSKIF